MLSVEGFRQQLHLEIICLPNLVITSSKGSLPFHNLETKKDILKEILEFNTLLMNCTLGLDFLTRFQALLLEYLPLSESSQKT